jgi:hypothetical protein
MTTIKLDIFSGRPNPVWTLTAKEENELFARVMADKSLAAPPEKVGHLGYRGFGIKVEGEKLKRWQAAGIPSSFFISGMPKPKPGRAKGKAKAENQRDASTEKFLLNTLNAGTTASDGALQVAQEYIDAANYAWRQRWINFDQAENGPPMTPGNRHEPLIDGTVIIPDPDGRGNPSEGAGLLKSDEEGGNVSALACGAFSYTSDTNFTYWNSDPYVMENNNCYNFAANYRSDTFAQPGRKSNVMWSQLACGNSPGQIGYAASYDGFNLSCWTSTQYYAALVIWPYDPYTGDGDFHWYRKCANGHWCHKPGHTSARNYDDSYYYITDPATCDRGPYTVFCSYRYFPTTYTVR